MINPGNNGPAEDRQHQQNDLEAKKEKYLPDAGNIEDLPEDEDGEPVIETGHSREWEDRARVVDADETDLEGFPGQSNVPMEDGHPKKRDGERTNDSNRFY